MNNQESNKDNDLLFQETIKDCLLKDLQRCIEQAKKLNLVVSIDLVSKEPLAQGNYDMVPHVRKANDSKHEFISQEEVKQIKDVLVKMKRQPFLMNWFNDSVMLCERMDGGVVPIGIITREVYNLEFPNITKESLQDVNSIDKSESS